MPKRLWTLLLLLLACDVSLVAAPNDVDGGQDGGSVDQATCPGADPGDDAACALPENTTCGFGTCGTRIAQCTSGRWIFGSNAPPRPPCPTRPPSQGDPCPDCWPGGTCTYVPSSCEPDDGSVPNTAVASCSAQVWSLAFLPCRDAGADVQGDGGPDGD